MADAIDVAEISEHTMVAEVGQRLASIYPSCTPDEISEIVRRVHARFAESRIRDYVPLLVERHARAELLARTQPSIVAR